MALKLGANFNNSFIVNCPQSAPVKNWSILGEDIDKSLVAHVYGPRCMQELRA